MDINGVDFLESSQEPRSPSPSWALDSSRAVRTLRTPGPSSEATRVRDAAALLGYATVESEVVTATTRVWITRRLPNAYPTSNNNFNPVMPEESWLYAASIPRSEAISSRVSWTGPDGDTEYADGWKYTVEYRAFPYNHSPDDDVLAVAGPLSADTPAGAAARPDEGDALRRGWATNSRFITKMVEPGARTLTLPNGFTKFVLVAPEADPQPVPIGLPVPFFRSTVVYTWHLVPAEAYPAAAVVKCANAVNDATFDGYAAETLLFSSARLVPLQGPFGDRLFNIEYRFLHQPLPDFDGTTYATKGWNHFPGVLSGKLRARQITASQAGTAPADNTTRIFKHQDFTSLFRPDQS